MGSEQIEVLRGRQCRAITFDTATEEWHFDFGNRVGLQVASPWRIVMDGAIRLGWRDDGQKFGLPSPVEGVREATTLLGDAEVRSAAVAAETAVLVITFGPACRLGVFNDSAGYEGWMLNAPGESLAAQGGGRLARWRQEQPDQ
jgi:hypothetical protein